MPKKIMLLVGDYAEDYETMVPYQMLLMAGHKVDAMCRAKLPAITSLRPFTILKVRRPIPKNRATGLRSMRPLIQTPRPVTTHW